MGRTPLIERRDHRFVVRDREEIEALLSRAYRKNITADRLMPGRATVAAALNANDPCLARIAAVHLRIPDLPDRSARDSLEAEDNFVKYARTPAIGEPRKVDSSSIDATEKLYNPDEPRVPAGSGRTSGQWTRDDGAPGNSLLGGFAVPAAATLADLTASAAESLGEFALRFLAPRLGSPAAAAFGLLFIPSRNDIGIEGGVEGVPGFHYAWNRDESLLHFTYDDADGKRTTFTAELEDDVFRDQRGQVVARVLAGGTIAIDTSAIFPDALNDNEPRLCPMPGLDKPGERGRDYEDYVKSIVNPQDTTPRYWGFQLADPESGKLVYYDDCQHTTGMMVEAKGPGYARLLTFESVKDSIIDEFLDESERQLATLVTRQLRWYFAEPAAAEFTRRLFEGYDEGRDRIDIEVLPWPEKSQ